MATEIPADVARVREEYEARILGLHMPATVRQAAELKPRGVRTKYSDVVDALYT
jgi:hypothetical protein